MQFRKINDQEVTLEQQAMNMERTMIDVRRHWFGAQAVNLTGAISVRENGSELLMCLDGSAAEVEATLMGAVARGAYIVITSMSGPADISTQLQRLDYRLVHQHGSYTYTPTNDLPRSAPERRGLLAIFKRHIGRNMTVDVIDEKGLEAWNEVCWTAFGCRGTLDQSLQEKQRAFSSMGSQARWYLANRGGRPAGTACVYYGPRATQVMAVGTLPSQQGRGVATAVMNRIIDDWEGKGAQPLFLDTRPSGTAERLYHRLGFRQLYVREVYAPAPSA